MHDQKIDNPQPLLRLDLDPETPSGLRITGDLQRTLALVAGLSEQGLAPLKVSRNGRAEVTGPKVSDLVEEESGSNSTGPNLSLTFTADYAIIGSSQTGAGLNRLACSDVGGSTTFSEIAPSQVVAWYDSGGATTHVYRGWFVWGRFNHYSIITAASLVNFKYSVFRFAYPGES